MAGEIYLTLATGTDRWDDGSLKLTGATWLLVSTDDGDSYIILNEEVADWCWDNIGAYRIIEHAPSGKFGPDEDDSWRIEFKTDNDMAFFKMRWG